MTTEILDKEYAAGVAILKWAVETVIPALVQDGAYFLGEEQAARGEVNSPEFRRHLRVMTFAAVRTRQVTTCRF
jgi:hypothetical protein